MKIGDLILRTFAVSFRILGHADAILTNPYQYAYGLPYSEDQVTNAVRRLVRNGHLDKEGRGAKAVYRLTESGEKKVRERMSRFLLEPVVWDGKWRLVVFDIEETQRNTRDRLRRFLKSVGFRRLQRSIWITPFPLREILDEFLDKSGLSKAAMVVEAKYVSGLEGGKLASNLWGLSELSERYRSFIRRCEASKTLSRELKEEFAKLVSEEPFLPEGLLPESYGRDQAFRAYSELLEKHS